MRKLFASLFALSLALCDPAQAGVTFQALGGVAAGGASSNNITTTANILSGNTHPLFVVASEHANTTFNTPTDSAGDTFVLLGTQFLYGSTSGHMAVWWVANPIGQLSGTTITISTGITSSMCAIAFQMNGASSVSQDASSPGTATSGTQSTGSIGANANNGFALTTQPATLIAGLVVDSGGFGALTEDTGDNWTNITTVTVSGQNSCSAAFQNVTATTAVKYQNAVWGSSSTPKWAVNEFAFDTGVAACTPSLPIMGTGQC